MALLLVKYPPYVVPVAESVAPRTPVPLVLKLQPKTPWVWPVSEVGRPCTPLPSRLALVPQTPVVMPVPAVAVAASHRNQVPASPEQAFLMTYLSLAGPP